MRGQWGARWKRTASPVLTKQMQEELVKYTEKLGKARASQYPGVPFCMAKRGTQRVLEYTRLAMGFANVRASRYGIR